MADLRLPVQLVALCGHFPAAQRVPLLPDTARRVTSPSREDQPLHSVHSALYTTNPRLSCGDWLLHDLAAPNRRRTPLAPPHPEGTEPLPGILVA